MSRIEFQPRRGMVVDFDLNPTKGSETGKIRPCIVVTNDIYNSRLTVIQVVPITDWSPKKSKIITNVTLVSSKQNGLSKKSIADCLQSRPIDYTKRLVKYRGVIEDEIWKQLNRALAIVFGIN